LNEKIKSKQRANKYHTVGIVPKSNRKIVETVAHSIPLDVYMTLFTGALIHGDVQLVLWAQTSSPLGEMVYV
jgi:hypothetical protein